MELQEKQSGHKVDDVRIPPCSRNEKEVQSEDQKHVRGSIQNGSSHHQSHRLVGVRLFVNIWRHYFKRNIGKRHPHLRLAHPRQQATMASGRKRWVFLFTLSKLNIPIKWLGESLVFNDTFQKNTEKFVVVLT